MYPLTRFGEQMGQILNSAKISEKQSLVVFHEFSSTEASWKDAEYECKNRYFASLATVQNFEEDHLLSQLSLTGTESLFKMLDRRGIIIFSLITYKFFFIFGFFMQK
jgi:hypothetical protein